ncbi:hypothetical protein M9H77_14345 [Catharanthus roseus]|uniref:Uncharacterized protein n=1 Tax=Catharanthus roseus TaxID=4058 RepID=A0ACC0BMS9_CATRO|nr:hypothetical protein M9H77_14345 [Catharanthus roseus]
MSPGAKLCKSYIQRFAMLGHKSEHKLVDLRIRLDMMTGDKVRWTQYKLEEITDRHRLTYLRRHGQVSLLYHHLGAQTLISLPHSSKDSESGKAPAGVQLSTATPITLQVLVDMISREVDRDDVDDATKIGRISDLIKKYNQPCR